MATKPGALPHGMNQHTAAVQHLVSTAAGAVSRTRKRRSATGRKRTATKKRSSGTRKRASSGGKFNSAAWMAKIRKLRGKGKKAKA